MDVKSINEDTKKDSISEQSLDIAIIQDRIIYHYGKVSIIPKRIDWECLDDTSTYERRSSILKKVKFTED